NGDLPDDSILKKQINIHLEGAVFNGARLNSIKLRYAHLSNSLFYNVHLEKVELIDVQFNNAKLSGVYLPRAYLQGVNFANSKWSRINLRNARIFTSNLADLTCQYIDITDKTEFNECNLNSTSIFENTSIGVIKNNKVKSQLTYAIRRFKWEKWYQEEREDKTKDSVKYKLLRLFWYCSDYGYSTKRIVGSFMIAAAFFAFVYWSVGLYDFFVHGRSDPCWGMVEGLFQLDGKTLMSPLSFLAIVRSFYFSVVTMTTLGFGDIYASYDNIIGHIVLAIQVIIGYVLLAVLVTRMSVLFSNDGPTYIPIKAARHKQNDTSIFYKWSAVLVIISFIIIVLEIITG
ncbi:MAG: pentapeptide repeat-containing protein, partial [Kiritimatiellae bacterium]|nr:pentapeptide repeat-containing protein [Kiritimatiellia bacterium]